MARKVKLQDAKSSQRTWGRGEGGYIYGLGPSNPYHQAEVPGQTKIRTRALIFNYMKMDVPGAGIMR